MAGSYNEEFQTEAAFRGYIGPSELALVKRQVRVQALAEAAAIAESMTGRVRGQITKEVAAAIRKAIG